MSVGMFNPLPAHVAAVREIVARHSDGPFSKARRKRNVENPPQQFRRDEFWFRMVTCICTSVQKAGPASHLCRFVREVPFPLRLDVCDAAIDLSALTERTLSSKGIRFGPKIGKWFESNLSRLKNGVWTGVEEHFYRLALFPKTGSAQTKITLERNAARAIMGRAGGLNGVGPKQARNIWQCMGITQFEIPIDSRVCKWAQNLQPELPIDMGKLYASVSYYEDVMTRIQILCQAAGTLPCEFDAAVFSSVDPTQWPEDDTVF